ncbi:hypothetical protein BG004_006584 [Podila humilis]|nr:hypothetical protein BG004_006584 [Podila humilis]
MDSDWCLFCEKHVDELGALYCSKECSRKDKLMSSTSKSFSVTPSAPSTAASTTTFTYTTRRLAPMTVTYTSMFRPSTLVPTTMSGRGGISKSAFTPIPTTTTSIRCLPTNRSSVRRQPLVLG